MTASELIEELMKAEPDAQVVAALPSRYAQDILAVEGFGDPGMVWLRLDEPRP